MSNSPLIEYRKPITIDDLRKNTQMFANYPALIQRSVLEHLSHITNNGVQIVDSTNPVAFTVEAAAVLTSEFITTDMNLNRKQYPFAAQTEDDLYLHMSDKDYIGRFALPSRVNLVLLMEYPEVLEKMVFDEVLEVKRLTIPRNTHFKVGGVTFTLEYPIHIQQYRHGGIQVLYDGEKISPIQELDSNIIDWEKIDQFNTSWLTFQISVLQTELQTVNIHVTPSAPTRTDLKFEDHFFYARVWYKNINDVWKEMVTTHTPELYDANKPTAVLKVTEGNLNVFVPQVYTNQNQINGEIRVDLYTTKGDLNLALAGYSPDDYETEFISVDKSEENEFTAPVRTLQSFRTFSSDRTTGGRPPLSFDELRERVITNSTGPKNVPISNVQITKVLEDEGFKTVKHVDLITNRAYLASRSLPVPSNAKLITAASASIETLITSIDGMKINDNIIDNKDSITLTPDVIYEMVNGRLQIVPTYQIRELMNLIPEQRVLNINKRFLFYTPFHYVMDMNENEFDLRAYYLDSPKVLNKTYAFSNPTTLIDVSIDNYQIVKTKFGYELTIMTKSSKIFKDMEIEDIHVQMAYRPTGEKDLAYLNGEFVGLTQTGEHLYKFTLLSNFNVDVRNELILTGFKMYDMENKKLGVPLTQTFSVTFMTTAQMSHGYTRDKMDDRLGHFMLPDDVKAIIQENVKIEFGKALNSLWKQSRTIASTEDYERHEEDVPYVYEKDEYDNVRVENGEVLYDLRFRKGEVKVGTNGEPILKHRRGDVKLGINGKPIIKNKRGLIRQMDLMLIEGAYYFATDSISQQYRQEIVDTFLDWMIDGLDNLNERTLEQTKIYFYPHATLGQVNIMYNNGVHAKIEAAQTLVVDLVVNRNVHSNLDLRKSITTTTIQVINDLLTNETISNSAIYAELVDVYGSDVLGVEISGLGGERDKEITAMTVLDENKRCCLKKRLSTQSDNTIIVEEDISVNFILMDKQETIW